MVSAPSLAEIQRKARFEEEEAEALELIRIYAELEKIDQAAASANPRGNGRGPVGRKGGAAEGNKRGVKCV